MIFKRSVSGALLLLSLAGCAASPSGTQLPSGPQPAIVTVEPTSDAAFPPGQVTGIGRPEQGRGNGIARLSTPLSDLYLEWQQNPGAALAMGTESGLQIADESVAVTITVESIESAATVADGVVSSGGEVTSQFETLIDAWVPIASLEEIANLQGVVTIQNSQSTRAPGG